MCDNPIFCNLPSFVINEIFFCNLSLRRDLLCELGFTLFLNNGYLYIIFFLLLFLIATVLLEQPLALPGSAKYIEFFMWLHM